MLTTNTIINIGAYQIFLIRENKGFSKRFVTKTSLDRTVI